MHMLLEHILVTMGKNKMLLNNCSMTPRDTATFMFDCLQRKFSYSLAELKFLCSIKLSMFFVNISMMIQLSSQTKP